MKEVKIEEIIIGRVTPHIYAFTTNTIPNCLKVGDTYRPVGVRLNEWQKVFPNLQKEFEGEATIDDEVFFRDHAVHQYLKMDLRKQSLLPTEAPSAKEYSQEFFKATESAEIEEAILDIKENYDSNSAKYKYYNIDTRSSEAHTYVRNQTFEPRGNQQTAIDNFKIAIENGRTNLLMYAVMRFGKSFTSLCCAKEMDAKIVLVVSAKADVKDEWQKTTESHIKFSNYVFLDDNALRDENSIENAIKDGKGVVVFLTLQTLLGDEIKPKHKEVFDNHIDLLIVDETHFGARAEKQGAILRGSGEDFDDFVKSEEGEEQVKKINAKIKLHLSGTPYRILMGSEFDKEKDLIAFCQFTDIVHEQEKWERENIEKDEPDVEWVNPYYGFPQMIRFAFNPSSSARQKLEELKDNGFSYNFSALLKPKSVEKDENNLHKQFANEQEVLELFEAIDGSSQDEKVLGFLNFDNIKQGKMCRHIVCVLPYCASCDALEELIRNNVEKFKNLNEYEIINISSKEEPNRYRNIKAVKDIIKQCEAEDIKTLTLTVNRMLTGTTVEEWDTMIFLKDTASPQEYDQAVFRLQNQYVKIIKADDGSDDVIKFNMKPQTLLVDFDPQRMFIMQEQKSLIYNANIEKGGNEKLRERIEEELRISPIITLNKDKLARVESSDIMRAISNYSSNRSVLDETNDIPIDLNLLKDDTIRFEIEKQAPIGSNQGFQTDAHEGDDDGTDFDAPDSDEENGADVSPQSEPTTPIENLDNSETKKLEEKFRTYYSRILFFAFLSKNKTENLDNILSYIDSEARLAENLGLNKDILASFRQKMNPFILNKLDNKIQNMNDLANDEKVEPIDRALTAIHKFNRLSTSEVTTPKKICEDMIELLPNECFENIRNRNRLMLDIGSKAGEYAIAICKKCDELNIPRSEIANSIVSIPTSTVAYEFTRKIYEVLGLSVNAIAKHFNAYDVIESEATKDANGKIDYEKIKQILTQNKPFAEITLQDQINNEEGEEMKIEAVVGNPPYNIEDGGAGASSTPIYNYFVTLAKAVTKRSFTMVFPTRWYAGGKGADLAEFRNDMLDDPCVKELHDFPNPDQVFPNTNIRGGVCYLSWDKEYDNKNELTTVATYEDKNTCKRARRPLKTEGIDIFIRNDQALSIINKVAKNEKFASMLDYVSALRPFGIRSYFITRGEWKPTQAGVKNPIKLYGKAKWVGYIEIEKVLSNKQWIRKWKVCTPRANNIGTELNDDNLNTFISEPNSVCTEAFMVVGADLDLDREGCQKLAKYMNTKFVRFLHSLAKPSQDATKKTYRFVPLQNFTPNSDIDWSKSISEIDQQLYSKYGLSQDEIYFIERMIKPMQDANKNGGAE